MGDWTKYRTREWCDACGAERLHRSGKCIACRQRKAAEKKHCDVCGRDRFHRYGKCLACRQRKAREMKHCDACGGERSHKRGKCEACRYARKYDKIYSAVGGAKCACCGYEKCKKALDFHHVYPGTKSFAVATGVRGKRSIAEVIAEARKCVILCATCHREVHAGVREIPKERLPQPCPTSGPA